MKKILKYFMLILLIGALVFTSRYAGEYMHWSTKSVGYPGLYEQTDRYAFLSADSNLLHAKWEFLAKDGKGDGDLMNWPDAKELHVYKGADTIWLAYALHNDININDPMVSVAIEEEGGKDWYGTVDFLYRAMISTGYYRKGDQYFGYNFLGEKKGLCSFRYSLANNTLYIGIPKKEVLEFKGRRFVASVGQRSYWNDDYDVLMEINQLLE